MMKDLTKGSPAQTLLQFASPMLLSMVFQQGYSLVDSLVAGNWIGSDGLASIGVSHPVTTLFLAIASGSSVGISVVLSHQFGANQIGKVKTSVSTALRVFMMGAVILTVLGFCICEGLLSFLQTPDSIFDSAKQYLLIYIAGIPFLFLYNIANGVFHALGDSKTPLYFLVFSSLFNIVLDLLFVVVFHFGILGIGFATFLAQGIAGVVAVCVMRKRIFDLKTTDSFSYYDQELLVQMMKISIPSILQQSFVSFGQMSIQGEINRYGSAVVAGYSAAFKLNSIVIMTFNTLSNAVSSFVAQNMGAKNLDRIKKGVLAAIKMTVCFGGMVVFVLLAGKQQWISLFLKQDGEAIEAGIQFVQIVCPFYLIVCFKIIADGALRGLGAMKEFLVGTFADLVIRVIFSIVFSRWFGYRGIWWVWPLAWIIGTIVSVLFYQIKIKQLEKQEISKI